MRLPGPSIYAERSDFCHAQDHLAIPVLYASSWLLTAFASDFPIFFASRIMDIILTDRYVVSIMKV